MSARARIHALFPLDEAAEAELDQRLAAYRAEVLAADGQAYDGELAMLRGLVRTLRVVVRPDTVDVAEVRRLLHEHASDDAAAREATGEKSTAPSSDTTPDPAELLAHASAFEVPRPGRLPLLVQRSYGHADRWAILNRDGRCWARDGYWAAHYGGIAEDRRSDSSRFTLAEAWPLAHRIAASAEGGAADA